MPVCIIGAARTPWTPRHGQLAGVAPEVLLAAALEAALAQSELAVDAIRRVLVACDTTVGAQALNIARRAVLALGWADVAAVTIDGQGVGDLAAVELAADSEGVTVVGAVDVTSVVPPGAALVRDYGRPNQGEPEPAWLERLALENGLDRIKLDATTRRLLKPPTAPPTALVPVRSGSAWVRADVGPDQFASPEELEASAGAGGVTTAFHHAALADGAAAVVLGQGQTKSARPITSASLEAGSRDSVVQRLREAVRSEGGLLVDPSAVIHALVTQVSTQIASVLATGSAPSADGLRSLVDAFHTIEGPCGIVRRGGEGQIGRIGLGPARGVRP